MATVIAMLRSLINTITNFFRLKPSINENHRNRWNFYMEEEYKENFSKDNFNILNKTLLKRKFAFMFLIYLIAFSVAGIIDVKTKNIEPLSIKMWLYVIIVLMVPIFRVIPKYYTFKTNYDSLVIYSWMLLVKDSRFDDALNFINKAINTYPEKDIFKSTKILTLLLMGNLNECKEYCLEIELNQSFSRDEDKSMIKNALYIIDYLQLKEVNPLYVPEIDSYPTMPINETYELAQLIHNSIGKFQIELDDTVKSLNESPVNFCKSVSYLVKAEHYYDLNNQNTQEHRKISALENSPSEEVTKCLQKHFEVMET